MNSYRLTNKVNSSKDSNKDIALSYKAGVITSGKYGEAAISGHFLLTTPHGKFPPMYVKQIEEKTPIWLNEMGLGMEEDYATNELQMPSLIAYTIPGVDPEKLGLYFKYTYFLFLFDDAVVTISELNKNNFTKQQKDILSIADNLIPIIESHGDGEATETAISKLDPIFKSTCIALSHVCSSGFKQMRNDEYQYFASELLNFIRVNKWRLEYENAPYLEKDYHFLRPIDGGVNGSIFLIYLAKGIYISSEMRMHPIFQRYFTNVSKQVSVANDILSLEKELPSDERINLVLIKCHKYSLQESLSKVEKIANDIVIELKKDKIRLKSYFPSDDNIKNFIEATEYAIDGFLYWHQCTKRYGNVRLETHVVEYDYDYKHWLEQIGISDIENMKEPEFSSEFNK